MKLKLSQIKPCDVASFRDKRVNDGVRACQYDLVLMRHAWNVATLEWGWRLNENPFKFIMCNFILKSVDFFPNFPISHSSGNQQKKGSGSCFPYQSRHCKHVGQNRF